MSNSIELKDISQISDFNTVLLSGCAGETIGKFLKNNTYFVAFFNFGEMTAYNMSLTNIKYRVEENLDVFEEVQKFPLGGGNADIVLSIERKGCLFLSMNQPFCASYLQEKLHTHLTASMWRKLEDFLNGVQKGFSSKK